MKRKKTSIFLLITLFVGFFIPSNIKSSKASHLFDSIPYFNLIKDSFKLTDSEINLLEQNKFVVLNRMGTEDLLDAYKYYWIEDLPIFITTDTLLHTWHLIFDHSLEDIEEYIFYPLFSELLGAMLFHAYEEYKNSLISENTLIYIAVAAKLANSTYGFNLPLNISNDIDFIVNSILEEISLPHAVNQFDSYRLKRFIDDFSQYMPRGHYTNSENLKNYFRLFKWFSRIPFFFDNYAGFRYLGVDPEEMIKSAIEVTWILKVTSLTWLGNSISGFKILQVFNSFLKAVLGKPNTVSPQVVDLICSSFFSEGWQINDIDINQFKEIILNNNSIPTPEAPFIIDALSGSVVSPKTFVILGEILTLDSYALNHLVLPYVGARFLPISLDFAATCLNSTRSKELLSDAYEHDSEYKNATDFLIDEIEHISGDEKLTIQWKWIESLKNLAALEPEYDNQINLPGFMNSSAWLDEKLTTILGSYAQLKHDLILYSKQSTTVLICSTPMGYVEPYPKFYQSLRFVSDFYKESLLPLESIGYNLLDSQYYYLTVLDEFHNATIMLENISIKELTGVPLNDNEKMFIMETYQEYYSNMCGDTGEVRGWLSEIIKKLEWKYRSPDSIPNSRVSLVTDLHTDLNSQSVLHIATGLFEPLIAIVPGWNGQDIAVIGPVFSFYEFILQDYQRINDNEWRGVLNLWFDSTNRSEYYFHIFKRCNWAESYMVSPEITRDILFHDYEWFSPPSWFANVSQSEYNPVDPPDDPPNNPNMNSWNILDIITIGGLIAIPIIITVNFVVKKKKRF